MTPEEWWALWREAGEPTLDVRSVVCQRCGAGIGQKCRRPSEHLAWSPHAIRWDDALLAYAGGLVRPDAA